MQKGLNLLILHIFDTTFSSVDCYTACIEREKSIEIAAQIDNGLRTSAQGFLDGMRIDPDFWIHRSKSDGNVLVANEFMTCVICWIIV